MILPKSLCGYFLCNQKEKQDINIQGIKVQLSGYFFRTFQTEITMIRVKGMTVGPRRRNRHGQQRLLLRCRVRLQRPRRPRHHRDRTGQGQRRPLPIIGDHATSTHNCIPLTFICLSFSRRGSLQLWQFLLALLNDAANQVRPLLIHDVALHKIQQRLPAASVRFWDESSLKHCEVIEDPQHVAVYQTHLTPNSCSRSRKAL